MPISTLQARLHGLSARERAIVDVVARLSTGVGRASAVEIQHLRTYGLRDTEIREVVEIATQANQNNSGQAQADVTSPTLFDTLPYFFEGTVPPGV